MKKHLLYILTISLFGFVAVVTYAAPITQNKELANNVTIVRNPNEVLATVNGEKILRLKLDRVLDKAKRHAKKSELHNIEERILNDLITQLVLKQFIRKENIQISSNRIEEEINAFRENIKSDPKNAGKTLETLLEEEGGSIDELRVAMDISLSIDEYLNRTTSEEEIKEYFTENIGNFNGETVTASHILIDTRNIKDEEGLNQAKERIEKLKKELDNGTYFAKLAEENSDCPSAKNGGRLGVIARGQMEDEFEKTAFIMEVNGISEPVKTKFGYHIIKITDKQAGREITFEETKDDVKLALFNEKTIALIQELNDKADVNVLNKPTPYTPAPPVSSDSGQHKQVETNQKGKNETGVQINSLDIEQDFAFRKTNWGMSETDVKESETLELFQEEEGLLAYKTKVLDKDVYVVYIFIDNQLVRTRYVLAESHSNENDYIDDYQDFKAILEKKYGKPLDDQTIWRNDLFKNEYSDWGQAISIGHLVLHSTWITSTTEIANMLSGDNYEITCLVEYRSTNLKKIENKAAEKKALGDF